jgi:hypothetical protein
MTSAASPPDPTSPATRLAFAACRVPERVGGRRWWDERVEWNPTIAVSDVVGHLDIPRRAHAIRAVDDGAALRFMSF